MHRLLILLPILSLACGQQSLDLQAAPHITPSNDPTVLGTIDEQVGPIAVDAERLYWMGRIARGSFGEVAALRSCKKEDCAGSLISYDSNAAAQGAFRVQNGQIYWFHQLADADSGQWCLLRCDVSGCSAGSQAVLVAGQLGFELAVGSDAIYYDVPLSKDSAVPLVGLYRVPLSGNTAPTAVAQVTDAAEFVNARETAVARIL
ncbi:MAG: hypothetical protein ABW061_02905 [Polyangiaceae bacterium]